MVIPKKKRNPAKIIAIVAVVLVGSVLTLVLVNKGLKKVSENIA